MDSRTATAYGLIALIVIVTIVFVAKGIANRRRRHDEIWGKRRRK